MRNHEKTETRKPAFQIDAEKLEKVATALGAGDVSECLFPDVKHVIEILARVQVIQDIAPGHLDEYFDVFIPHFTKERNKAILAEEAQRRAEAQGFGEEWRETITAGRHPQQKDFLWKRVQLYMKVNNVSEADAIRALAAHLEKDEGDVRRTVTRSKSRRS